MGDMSNLGAPSTKPPSALVLLHPGMEELECIAPVDVLRRAGVEVQLMQLTKEGEQPWVEGKNGIRIGVEKSLPQIEAGGFDLLLIPGGPGVAQLREDTRVIDGLRAFAAAGRWLACICAAPLLLHDAGLLEDKHYTAHPTTRATLTQCDPQRQVVIDGRLVTASGAGPAIAFGLSLVSCLIDRASAETVAKAIEFDGDFPG
jgi:4-methyl-5(b-hydroxyethyl)-thiazole monophosphate biosynthesis